MGRAMKSVHSIKHPRKRAKAMRKKMHELSSYSHREPSRSIRFVANDPCQAKREQSWQFATIVSRNSMKTESYKVRFQSDNFEVDLENSNVRDRNTDETAPSIYNYGVI